MTKRIEPTVTIPTSLLADICDVIDALHETVDQYGYNKEVTDQLKHLLAQCEKALLKSEEGEMESEEKCQALIVTEPEEFRAIKREIVNNQSAVFENITDFEKTKKITCTLDELYLKLGVLCANHCAETWIR